MIFSIVIPICNGELFLHECIDSAVSQDLSFAENVRKEDAYEVILVENGSKDSSPSICDEYAEKYENVSVIHKGKIGLYSARQVGIKAAKGDWILAMDADDRLHQNALSRLFCEIKKFEESGELPEFILFDAAGMGRPSTPLSKRVFEAGKVYSDSELDIFKKSLCMDDSINAMWTKCIKRDIAYLGNTDMYLNYGEDLYQTAEYLDRATAAVYIGEILYYYREDASSLSSNYSEVYLDNQKITWGKLEEMVEKWHLTEHVERINRRKALTCTIAVTKLIYSGMSFSEKKYKLGKLMEDEFYKEYHAYELPEWAPEESLYVRKIEISPNPGRALLAEAVKTGIKNWIKERVR